MKIIIINGTNGGSVEKAFIKTRELFSEITEEIQIFIDSTGNGPDFNLNELSKLIIEKAHIELTKLTESKKEPFQLYKHGNKHQQNKTQLQDKRKACRRFCKNAFSEREKKEKTQIETRRAG